MNMCSTQHSNSVIINGGGSNMTEAAEWSWPDNKIFEDALVEFPEESPDRWQKIAGRLPGKSPRDVIAHYEALLHDVAAIEADRVQVPSYPELTKTRRPSSSGLLGSTGNRRQCVRKKGKPWTVGEHKLFLRGLEIYGKSDWRSISRNVVISRLPSQVASHAQKFFNRQKSGKKERKRASIHDITSVSDCPRDFLTFQESSDDSGLDYLALPDTPDTVSVPQNTFQEFGAHNSFQSVPQNSFQGFGRGEKSFTACE